MPQGILEYVQMQINIQNKLPDPPTATSSFTIYPDFESTSDTVSLRLNRYLNHPVSKEAND